MRRGAAGEGGAGRGRRGGGAGAGGGGGGAAAGQRETRLCGDHAAGAPRAVWCAHRREVGASATAMPESVCVISTVSRSTCRAACLRHCDVLCAWARAGDPLSDRLAPHAVPRVDARGGAGARGGGAARARDSVQRPRFGCRRLLDEGYGRSGSQWIALARVQQWIALDRSRSTSGPLLPVHFVCGTGAVGVCRAGALPLVFCKM